MSPANSLFTIFGKYSSFRLAQAGKHQHSKRGDSMGGKMYEENVRSAP